MQSLAKSRISIPFNLAGAVLLAGVIVGGFWCSGASAGIEATFLYTLSNFNGRVPSNWASINVDDETDEIYIADTRGGDIRIFNDKGMEIYRFGDDGRLGTILDVAVEPDGDILVLSRTLAGHAVIRCNFKGEPLTTVELKNLPPAFSDLAPSSMVLQQGELYLMDKASLRLAVVDPDGQFETGYDIAALINIAEDKRSATEIGGFSVDREGNLLFTVPVLFRAFKMTPDGKVFAFGRSGSAPGRFGVVGGIVADDQGYFYVADRLKSAVIVFDRDFNFQLEFGYRGFKPENLFAPRELGLDQKGRLYVSQVSNRGISVFKITRK
jgi:DNA-binding beta-propeller fold protein YncE